MALMMQAQGLAAVRTAKDGGYRFRTIKPKGYKAGSLLRTPHIHVHLMQGSATRLVTQMYFPGEKLNKSDFLFAELNSPAQRNAATARVINVGTLTQYQYNITNITSWFRKSSIAPAHAWHYPGLPR